MTLDLYLSLPHLIVSSVGQRMIDDRLAGEGLSRRIALTVPSLAGVIAILEHSDLCAVLPDLWLQLYCAPGRLATAALPMSGADFTVDLVWRAQDERDAGHRWLRELIVEERACLFAALERAPDGSPHRLEHLPAQVAES